MAFLKILSGENEGKQFDIPEDGVSIGRAPDNVIQVTASATSSHHCQVSRRGNRYTLKDLNSTNGTGLNGIAVQEARLKPRDIITAGGVEILFDGDDVEIAASSAREAIGPSDTVRIANFSPTMISNKPPSFGTRRDTKKAWLRIIIVVAVLALGALAWFFYKLFGPSVSP